MQKKNFSIVLVLFLVSAINLKCTSIDKYNVPLCVELEMDRGWCFYAVTNDEFYWDEEHKFEGKTWWEARPTMIILPPKSWQKIKTEIIKDCKDSTRCKSLGDWDRKIIKADNVLEKSK